MTTAAPKISLGILDFGYRHFRVSPLSLLQDVVDYCSHAEKLGYSHYWLSEHHGSTGKAWSNPEILISVLLSVNHHIHIGAAGILIKCHSPYRIALNFKLLAALFPDRVDLGLAYGNVEPILFEHLPVTKDMSVDASLEMLLAFLNEKKTEQTAGIKVPPVTGNIPRVWRLSKSFNSVTESAKQKVNHCASVFHAKFDFEMAREKLQQFRAENQTNDFSPRVNLCFAGVLSDSKSETARILSQYKGTVPGLEGGYLTGSYQDFQERIMYFQEVLGLNEFTFLDLSGIRKNRFRTLEQLSTLTG